MTADLGLLGVWLHKGENVDLGQAVLHGLLLSVVLSILILGALAYNPRLFLQDFPKPIQEALPPLTNREKRERLLVAVPFLIAVLGIPLWGVLSWSAAQGDIGFLEAFAYLWVVWMVFNAVDLVILDWLIVVAWHPRFITPPEFAPLLHHNTYRFHFIGFLKGTALITVASAVLGLVLSALL